MAKETFSDFQPSIANIYNTLYINKNGEESEYCEKFDYWSMHHYWDSLGSIKIGPILKPNLPNQV